MHFFFFVRGIYDRVELFKTLAQGQFWKWERTNLKTGKKETTLVQGSLRPSIFGAYEYVFPQESLTEVIACFKLLKESQKYFGNYPVRKIFNCKKIPEKIFKEAEKIPHTILVNGTQRGLSNLQVDGVHIIPIGIKDDKRTDIYGYEQEAL